MNTAVYSHFHIGADICCPGSVNAHTVPGHIYLICAYLICTHLIRDHLGYTGQIYIGLVCPQFPWSICIDQTEVVAVEEKIEIEI